jgi:NitT/TauT family transport system permease protein
MGRVSRWLGPLMTLVAMAGLAIAIVLGMAVAVAMSQALWVENSLYPYAGWTGPA